MAQQDGLPPDEIVVSRDRREMTLHWADGRDATVSANALRSSCRCAWCTRDRILDRFAIERDGVTMTQVETLGSHGLHIKFSDGHERGIYPWTYLDDLASGRPIALRHGERATASL